MDTYVYQLKDTRYINLTNRCTNNCTFCLRNTYHGVGGYDLRLEKEPEADDIIAKLEKQGNVEKVVFCGLGEPTMRLSAMLDVAKYLKRRGSHVRLNTNGQGSAFAGRDIAPELRGVIDTVSISLNASSAKEYQKLCRSVYGEQAYSHLLNFAKSCLREGIETLLSVVDIIGENEIDACRRIAAETGANFRLRHYVE
ncbi:MAG: TatD family nuclease-associated radical SAM protein [Eubacteriales bacterium]|nr:TatD family nuclease-associated radical SAM protein [Eubacteriales bacterium]